MKRSWIGFFLLILLLGLGLLSTWAIDETHEPISENLEAAAEQALKGSWREAALFAAQARSSWEKWNVLRAALTDHVPIEEIDAQFQVLEVYSVSREEVAFAALCRELAEKIQAIGDAHGLVPENIL